MLRKLRTGAESPAPRLHCTKPMLHCSNGGAGTRGGARYEMSWMFGRPIVRIRSTPPTVRASRLSGIAPKTRGVDAALPEIVKRYRQPHYLLERVPRR